ncbi:hypothetical protein BXY51_002100 [Actinoplanes cyaneus]|jgi:hypothetical protein|nr:hypothetical protein [Actinoplanes cyaneus]
MRGLLRAGLIACVVLGSVTVTDEARAICGTGITISVDAADRRG